MPKQLSSAAIDAYRRDGYYFPGAGAYASPRWRTIAAASKSTRPKTGAPLQGNWRHKAHLLFTWVDELVHHPKIVDAAEDVLGPNLLCWTTNFFIKEANSPGFVSWHQDAFYWGSSKDDVMTAWVALSPANLESGCMKFLPGSQTQDHLQHVDTFHKDNLLSRGQEIAVKVDRREDGRLHSQSRRDVAASRQAGARLGAQPLQRPAHRPGDPLHPNRRQAAEGARLGDPRARRGSRTATSITSRARSATSTSGARGARRCHRPAGQGALFRHRQAGVSRLTRSRSGTIATIVRADRSGANGRGTQAADSARPQGPQEGQREGRDGLDPRLPVGGMGRAGGHRHRRRRRLARHDQLRPSQYAAGHRRHDDPARAGGAPRRAQLHGAGRHAVRQLCDGRDRRAQCLAHHEGGRRRRRQDAGRHARRRPSSRRSPMRACR